MERTMVVGTCASCNVRCKIVALPFPVVVDGLRDALQRLPSVRLEGDEAQSDDEHTFHVMPEKDDGMWGPIHVIRLDDKKDVQSHGWNKPEIGALFTALD